MSEKLPDPILPIAYPKRQASGTTGEWSVSQPEIDYHQCNGCGICVMVCPEGAITLDSEDSVRKPLIDFTVCKGCFLCRHECGRHAMDSDRGSN
ncbi:MAG: 4Fe-4S binding protein [Candidatus Hodarchaeales archaeon]|jgi:2-oxoacid:acceptor oxidoreductase delta subunit (pyruvate/2-ketoisovalerate family)